MLVRLRPAALNLSPVPEILAASSSLPKVAEGRVDAWNKSVSDDDVRAMYSLPFAEQLPAAAGLGPHYSTATVGVRLGDVESQSVTKPPVFMTARIVPEIGDPQDNASTVEAPAYGIEARLVSTGGKTPPQLEELRRFPLSLALALREC